MKKAGSLKGIPVYVDPSVPPNTVYFLNVGNNPDYIIKNVGKTRKRKMFELAITIVVVILIVAFVLELIG